MRASQMSRGVEGQSKCEPTTTPSVCGILCVKIAGQLVIRMLSDELNINRETVRKILVKDVCMKIICAKMVSKNLSEEQKHVRMCANF